MDNNTFELTDKQWDYFKNNKLVVRCNTKEDADQFMQKCEEQELEWPTRKKPTEDNHWSTFGEDVAEYTHCSKGLQYADGEYYEKHHPNIPIITYGINVDDNEIEEIINAKTNNLSINLPFKNCLVPLKSLRHGEIFIYPNNANELFMKIFPVEVKHEWYDTINLRSGLLNKSDVAASIIKVKGTLNVEYDI